MLRFDKATDLSLIFKFILSVVCSILSYWVVVYEHQKNAHFVLYLYCLYCYLYLYNVTHFLSNLLFSIQRIYDLTDLRCDFWVVLPAFTCASAIYVIWSICLSVKCIIHLNGFNELSDAIIWIWAAVYTYQINWKNVAKMLVNTPLKSMFHIYEACFLVKF